jgi:hypothetical protein
MNVNELADKLMSSLTMEYDCDEYMEQAATMLCQQAKEIAMLKQIIDANNLQSDIGQLDTRSYLIGRYDGLRELTDEEIRKVADEVFKDYKNWHYYQIDFARAILKKASDK